MRLDASPIDPKIILSPLSAAPKASAGKEGDSARSARQIIQKNLKPLCVADMDMVDFIYQVMI